jgi:hypothetical protein
MAQGAVLMPPEDIDGCYCLRVKSHRLSLVTTGNSTDVLECGAQP